MSSSMTVGLAPLTASTGPAPVEAVLLFPSQTPPREPAPPPAAEPAAEAEPLGLEQALERLAAWFGAEQPGLRFRIDQDSERLVVQVVDAVDGQVLRQIPSEEALRLAKALEDLQTRSQARLFEGEV